MWKKMVLLLPVVLAAVFIIWTGTYKVSSTSVPEGGWDFIRYFSHNIIFEGKGTGYYDGREINADYSSLQPGDIILCTDPGGAYGYWTHATIYLGDGYVAQCLLLEGVYKEPVERCSLCHEVAVLRVNTDSDKIKNAVTYVKSQIGKPFSIFTGKYNDRVWYCTKLVWAAYKSQGIDLSPNEDWPLPDSFFSSPYVKLIYRY